MQWKDLRPGEVIYLLGTREGKSFPYGPHEVIRRETHTLRNLSKLTTFTVTDEPVLRRDGPTVVVTTVDGKPGAVYADVPLEVVNVDWSGDYLTQREFESTRPLTIQSLPGDMAKAIASRKLTGWPSLYGKFDIVDSSIGASPFQMRTVNMTNKLALNALVLHLLRQGQDFHCTPKVAGGEVTMTEYAWRSIQLDFADLVEGTTNVIG